MDFETYLAEFRRQSTLANRLNRDHALGEIEMAKWLNMAATSLLGSDNIKTSKPHSWTSAEAAVKETADYHTRLSDLIHLKAQAEAARSEAKACYAAALSDIATRTQRMELV